MKKENIMRLKKKLKIIKMLQNILHKTMETYCVSYKKSTTNKSSGISGTKQNRLML